MVLVDGLQRITAVLEFIKDRVAVFGGYVLSDFGGYHSFLTNVSLRVSINNLETRADVLEWYLAVNSGGTMHTDDELSRVRKLLEQEHADGINV
jgi:hypothetical protein